jgi:predicted RNA-binding protein YlxR (DUF448 family)
LNQKKTPRRQCIGCGQQKDKKELLRILKTPDGDFVVDPTGRMNGRGAYICPGAECFQKARKGKGLERSFKMAIPKEVYDELEKGIGRI